MTPVQIAYFKHFIYDSSLQRHYIGAYRKRRQKENPESLEEFLQEASPSKAIMGAFYFKPGSEYGFDYWNEIKEKWLQYWEMQADNPKNSSYMFLKGGFAILRQNWDNEIFYEKENDDDTYRRMKIEKPDIDESVLSVKKDESPYLPKFKVGDIVRGTISGDICKITEIVPEHKCYLTDDDGAIGMDREDLWELVSEGASDGEEEPAELIDFSDTEPQETEKPEPGSLLEGFSVVETLNPQGGRKMGTNVVSVNMKSGYRMTFSTKQSDELRKHGYEYVKLLTKEDTKEIALIFNHLGGCSVTIKRNSSETRNVTINSKDIVEHVHKFFSLRKLVDYFQLEITATIKQDNNIIFKLKLKENYD